MTAHSNIDPTRAQFDAFKSLPRDQPVNMLNLVKLKDAASYADGRSATGAEAYQSYSAESGPIFARVGGEIIWRGSPQAMVIGPENEDWHIAFIARYPTLNAFLEMVTDPAYQAIVFHRQAAVADSRLIAHHDLEGGPGFG
ncbi:DUF1330 domain-containing protein [Roseobacter sp. N2S]|uniref:DUF1330 domain-containing protein n=1 Tax=Roseobacter sp. N2S TaxID=2663844 RepID=UPI00285934FF|nr:DUF1330 domain-containing protein [Roseobacter sp. N2S]MDR6267446.1 uncharacterized protein (DUF1330 family) [Roseobacter sp. N2S]